MEKKEEDLNNKILLLFESGLCMKNICNKLGIPKLYASRRAHCTMELGIIKVAETIVKRNKDSGVD